jgi:alkanesulfonate monooxygenase
VIPDSLQVFSTCLESTEEDRRAYVQRAVDIGRWSEEAGCKGMLIYADNRLVDPWLVAQTVLASTEQLCPLVAVQPVYMHPYTVANLIASLGYMYGRRICLNMIAGGFKNDLIAMNDSTPHDKRYDRLVEYTQIVQELLANSSRGVPLTFRGEFYTVENLKLTPSLPLELLPGVFVSGSSDPGLAAARSLGATAVQYPLAPGQFGDVSLDVELDHGIRLGIIARDDEDEAWTVAESRFPPNRKGQLTRQMANRVSDSVWHERLSEQAEQASEGREAYWLGPYENYSTMCPYLVGRPDRVAELLRSYVDKGYRTFILDIPPDADELRHIAESFRRCVEA